MDLLTLFNLAGYLLWPLLLIGLVVFLRNPRMAWQNTKTVLQKIFSRSKKP